MTPTEIKAVFRQYLPAKRELDAARRAVLRVRSDAQSLRATVGEGMPRAPDSSDTVERAIEQIDKYERRLAAKIADMMAALKRVEQLIELADDVDGRTIIRLRWLEGIGFDFIPARINLCRRAVFSHYETAIREISAKTESVH